MGNMIELNLGLHLMLDLNYDNSVSDMYDPKYVAIHEDRFYYFYY